MSETDTQRLSLVGVNANSRSLKFLNTKNNIASMTLKKQLAGLEREKTFSISLLDSQRHDTQSFLKQVKSLEQDTEESKRLISRDNYHDSMLSLSPETQRRRRRRRKVRLAQTAPANGHHSNDDAHRPRRDLKRKETISGPETQAEKDRMMKIDRKKSVFLQLPGKGRATENYYDIPDEKTKRPELPKPNPKTLLEVMIGLNAFSQIPSRIRSNSEISDYRGDSRMSITDQDSMYDSQENVARRFMTQWKNKVASRKFSLLNKLETTNSYFENPFPRCESTNLSSVPEDISFLNQSRGSHRKSKWTVRHSMKQPSLPAIDDEEERQEQFMEWVSQQQAKWRSEKESFFQNVSVHDKLAQRRKSFICWLRERQTDTKRDDDSDDEPEIFAAGGLRNIIEHEEEDEDDEDGKPANIGDLMRTLLNIKSRFKDPLESRVKRFNEEIDNIKRRQEAERNKEMSKSQKRRWKMLMKGIDAALADSSDEEENYYSTI